MSEIKKVRYTWVALNTFWCYLLSDTTVV